MRYKGTWVYFDVWNRSLQSYIWCIELLLFKTPTKQRGHIYWISSGLFSREGFMERQQIYNFSEVVPGISKRNINEQRFQDVFSEYQFWVGDGKAGPRKTQCTNLQSTHFEFWTLGESTQWQSICVSSINQSLLRAQLVWLEFCKPRFYSSVLSKAASAVISIRCSLLKGSTAPTAELTTWALAKPSSYSLDLAK